MKEKRFVALLLSFVMMFSLSLSVFANSSDEINFDGNITVSLVLDTRTLQLEGSPLTYNDGSSFLDPITSFDVTVPSGSTAFTVLSTAADQYFDINYVGDGENIFITDIAGTGSTQTPVEEQELYFLHTDLWGSTSLLSGWVFSIDGVFPLFGANHASSIVTRDGQEVYFAFTVTGSYDPVTQEFQEEENEYKNWDIIFLNLLEEASNNTDFNSILIVQRYKQAIENSTLNGYISPYFFTAHLYGEGGAIEILRGLL